MLDVSKRYGEKNVLSNISLSFYYGAKIGVIGENGSGKSTLLRIMAGIDKDFHGEARLAPKMKVRYVAQEPQIDLNKTIRENLMTAIQPTLDMVDRFNKISEQLAEPQSDEVMNKLLEELGVLQDKIDACEGWETDRLMDIVSDAMVLPPDNAPVSQLSGGERRRVALAMALLEKPDLLLLDEPTNHLDAETVQWLEVALRDYPGTVIIATHDRYLLDNITKWILELDKSRGIPFRCYDSTPIVPIITGETMHTLRVSTALYDAGVYVNPVLPPATAPNECLLRTSLMATHTEDLLDEAADIFAKVLRETV